jgi:hypothetical protein
MMDPVSIPPLRGVTLVAILLGTVAVTHAQWANVAPSGIPRTPDGKPNLSAVAPRLQNGVPDLSGIWQSVDGRYVADIAADLKPENVPFQPWAKAIFEERRTGLHYREDPPANCLPAGVPRTAAAPLAWQIIQAPGHFVVLYEAMGVSRHIFMDGRDLAPLDTIDATWMGYSTGRWDGDVLVVDTKGFNGKAWLDQSGKPTTTALHVIERFHRTEFGRMQIHITIDDPQAYTEPWVVTQSFRYLPDTQLTEFICNENNATSSRK